MFTLKPFEKQKFLSIHKICPKLLLKLPSVFVLFFLHGSFSPLCWLVVDVFMFFYTLQPHSEKKPSAGVIFILMQKLCPSLYLNPSPSFRYPFFMRPDLSNMALFLDRKSFLMMLMEIRLNEGLKTAFLSLFSLVLSEH